MNHPGDARRRRAPPPDNRRAVPRSSLQLVTFSLALAAVTLPEISAHPTLVEHELCGDEAHPTTKRHHGAPVHDGTISFLLSWAAPDGSADPQPDEDQPKRRIPEVRGARYLFSWLFFAIRPWVFFWFFPFFWGPEAFSFIISSILGWLSSSPACTLWRVSSDVHFNARLTQRHPARGPGLSKARHVSSRCNGQTQTPTHRSMRIAECNESTSPCIFTHRNPCLLPRLGFSSPRPSPPPLAAYPVTRTARAQEQNIATAEYKPGGRHVLTVTIPLEGELLLTASAGAFEEFGQHNDGKLNYGRATMCDGKRSNLKGDWSTAMFVWTAPTLAVENGGVKFRITTARGSHAGFRQNDVTLSPNADLPLPGAAAAAPSANYYPPPHGASLNTSTGVGGVVGGEGEPINVKFVIHGWLMAVGWGFFVPAGVWAVRYLRPPDDAPPAKSALVESLRSRWLQLHWMINAAGLSCAAVGLFLSYSAVEDESGGGDDTASAHLSSNHSYYGAGTLLLGMYQPLNAFLRPANTNNNLAGSGAGGSGSGGGKSTPRVRWERVHRVAGVLGLFLSAVAVTSGAEVAEEWGAVKGGPLAYNAYVAWVVLAAVATCVMEAVRWRERRGVEAAWRGTESRSFVELTEDI